VAAEIGIVSDRAAVAPGIFPTRINMIDSPFVLSLLAQAPGAPPAGNPGSGMQPIIMMVLFMVIFWVVLIRPQRKRQKEHEARLAALKKGDRVVTLGGVHGLIEAVRDTTLSLKIAEGVRVDIDKAAVARVLASAAGEAAPAVKS
jgi:preprotein translocase subunit YajC